ncbi:MAG: transposase [Magnetovibrio sp.]|nr:transposase [Magnetovibrio sp.]
MVKDVQFKAFLGDKAFDANGLRDELMDRKVSVVIPSKSNRKSQIPHNKEVYKWRHLVENYFAKIKKFKGISTGYDKTGVSYIENWTLTTAIIAAR